MQALVSKTFVFAAAAGCSLKSGNRKLVDGCCCTYQTPLFEFSDSSRQNIHRLKHSRRKQYSRMPQPTHRPSKDSGRMPCSAGGGALMTLNVSARINRPLSVGSQCSRRFRVRSSVLACVLLDRKVYLTDARTHRDRYTQISGRRQRRRVYARFIVTARVVYSTLHSARTTHTHARPALCTRALERVCWEPNSVSSLCTLRLVLRRGPGFHLQRVYLWHLLR